MPAYSVPRRDDCDALSLSSHLRRCGFSAHYKGKECFRRARSTKSRNMSRDNSAHQSSRSIYVGTSKNMYNRFRSHLGTGTGTATWGLYLSAWAVPLGAKFLVEYYEFKDSVGEDIELIEGVLWDSLRPLFGKKGGK